MLKIFLLMNLFFLNTYAQDIKEYVKMGAVTLKIQNEMILAISLENEKDWHTYWKNPGDAGTQLQFTFEKKDGHSITLKDLPWPTPTRYIEQGNMWAYGYSDKYAFFYKLPNELKNSTLKIVGTWLVCKDICIPGTRTIYLALDENGDGEIQTNHKREDLKVIHANLPVVQMDPNLSIFLTKGEKENQLALHYILENVDLKNIRKKSNIITPYLQAPFDFKHEEVYFDKESNILFGRIYLDWDGIYEEPVWHLPQDGKFTKPISVNFLLNYPKNSPSKIMSVAFNEFSLTGDRQLSNRFNQLHKIDDKTDIKTPTTENSAGLLSYILFAFLGGLILNLMPCVLPVISLKLFGLIAHRDETNKSILKHNMAYTFGVLFSFFVLATSIALLKSAGQKIGWGFQLQSPIFVFAMIILIFIMALNMLGLFQFMTPGGKSLGNTELKKGMSADFLNGILATILSTPCSAPFLGTALSVAFTTSIFNSYLIFLSVGIGLSFPFIITGIFPKLINFLPKPGLWMEKLKFILGLTLILTVIWLIDVLFAIVSFSDIGLYFNAGLLFIFFTLFSRKYISKNLFSTVFLILVTFFFMGKAVSLFGNLNTEGQNQPKTSSLNWEPWSKDKMLKTRDQFVFINFTAKWCLTCKVNKKLVLESKKFEEFSIKNNIKLMEGDWTKRDDEITTFLNSYDIYGVPAYFIQDKSGKIFSLGETITLSKVKDFLSK